MNPAKKQTDGTAIDTGNAVQDGETSSAHWPDVLIRASAGTGKTFQLSNRYLQLILSGQSVDGILATTFTRKAAGEILSRVMFRLAEAAASENACAKLTEELKWEALSTDQCRRVLRRVTRNLHRLRVSTLDSFFLQATQSLSLELGLPPRWQIIDELEEKRIRDDAIARLLQEGDRDTVFQLMHWLSKGEARRGVHDLVRDTVTDVYEIFLEAPAECWQKISRLSAPEEHELLSAVEQLANVEVTDALRKVIDEDRRLVLAKEWDVLAAKGVSGKVVNGETKYRRSELTPEVLGPYRVIADYVIAELRNRIITQTESTFDLLQRYHEHYDQIKLSQRGLRFSDLARYLANFQHDSKMSRLNYRLDGSVENLLLDEFQDTSLYQWQVIRPFAQHTTEDAEDRSFFCVGDKKQAIYGWRGGDADLLDAVGEELELDEELPLDKSFRSSQLVMDVVNQINSQMGEHSNLGRAQSAVDRWTAVFPKHETAKKELDGQVLLRTAPAVEEGRNETQTDVTLRHAAERVAELARQAPQISIAILTRSNKSVGKLINELHRLGVPASEEGGNPLDDSAAVQLVLSLLRLADHPADRVARYHLSRSPWAKLLDLDFRDDGQAFRLSRRVRGQLAELGYGATILSWAKQLQPHCNRREWRRLGQLVELAYVHQAKLENPRSIGHQMQYRLSSRCLAFIEFVESYRVADPSSDSVRVMTVHQSKGLQFDYVVLPDLEGKLIPSEPRCVVSRPSASETIDLVSRYANEATRGHLPSGVQRMFENYSSQAVRESLCVLYVALTRAVHGFEMIIAPSKPNERSLPATPAGLIRAAITDSQPAPPANVLFEVGNERWWNTKKDEPSAEERPVQVVDRVRLAKQPSKNTHRKYQLTSPSGLEGDGLVRLDDRLRTSNSQAMELGSLIHQFFEQIEWVDPSVPDEESLRALAQRSDVNEEHIQQAISDFQEMLRLPQITKTLSAEQYQAFRGSGESRLEVRCEQPIAVTRGDELLSGFIDRLVIVYEGDRPVHADIIDYKTDRVDDAQVLEQRVAYYRPQLKAYAEGVQRMLQLNSQQVTARLLFVTADRMVDVT